MKNLRTSSDDGGDKIMKQQPNVKRHFKMYKGGKLWLVAGITVAGLMIGGQVASADTTTATDMAKSSQVVTNGTEEAAANSDAKTASDTNTDALTATDTTKADSQTTANTDQSTDKATTGDATAKTDTTDTDAKSTDTTSGNTTKSDDTKDEDTTATDKDATKDSSTTENKTSTDTDTTKSDDKTTGDDTTKGDTTKDDDAKTDDAKTDDGTTKQTVNKDQTLVTTKDGKVSLLDKDGKNVTGWATINNQLYYFGKDNYAVDGLQTIDKTVHYFVKYIAQSGWQKVTTTTKDADGKDVETTLLEYFDPETTYYSRVSGEKFIKNSDGNSGKWYYFSPTTGAVAQGFAKLPDGRIVYYDVDDDANGEGMLHGFDNGIAGGYYFNKDTGALETGLKTIDVKTKFETTANAKTETKTYYFNPTTKSTVTDPISGKTITIAGQMDQAKQGNFNGKWYYFGDDGAMVKSNFAHLKDGRWMYYNADGVLQYGEQYINGKWYYFDKNNGALQIGWFKLPDGRTVYYNVTTDGEKISGDGMLHGIKEVTQEVNGKTETATYYFNQNTGALETGLKTIDGKTYYFDPNAGGKMIKAHEANIAGKWYYFNDKGVRVESAFNQLNDGRTMYYNADGVLQYGEQYINGKWYYFDKNNGAMQIGWFTMPDKNDGRVVYYDLKADGSGYGMLHGVQTITTTDKDGKTTAKTYYFDVNNGARQTGVHFNATTKQLNYFDPKDNGALAADKKVTLSNVTYTADKNGALELKVGENYVAGNWYLYNKDKTLATGFILLADGRTVYYDPSTAIMAHGEKNINGHWYYFDQNDGHMATGITKLSDGRYVFYSKDQSKLGQMQYGEVNDGGYWYYFTPGDGHMVRGWQNLPDGRTVYYNSQGHMLYGFQTINNWKVYFNTTTGALVRYSYVYDGNVRYYARGDGGLTRA